MLHWRCLYLSHRRLGKLGKLARLGPHSGMAYAKLEASRTADAGATSPESVGSGPCRAPRTSGRVLTTDQEFAFQRPNVVNFRTE